MLTRVVQVEVHLASVGVREPVELQIDDDEASQSTMEEQEVDPVPSTADPQPPLAAHEREVTTKLEKKCLQLGDQRKLEITFRVFVLEVQELEEERILDLFLGCHQVLGRLLLPFAQHRRLVLRERRPFVELVTDLPIQLTHSPAPAQRLGLVAATSLRVTNGE